MKVVICDNCGEVITAAIYPFQFDRKRKDACSPKCLEELVVKEGAPCPR